MIEVKIPWTNTSVMEELVLHGVPIPHLRKEVEIWLVDHSRAAYSVHSWTIFDRECARFINMGVRFCFDDREDALLFRLNW